MFLDSSAVIALLVGESEAAELDRRIDEATSRLISSPIVLVETALNLARIKNVALPAAREAVLELFTVLKVQVVHITPEMGRRALEAYGRYGKGSGHPAQLNLADVFSYACAKNYNIPLLYKGDDFSHTDLA